MSRPATTSTQRRQLGAETAPGDATVADRIVEGLTLTPNIEVETEPYTPDGAKLPAAVLLHREHTALTGEGVPCYRALTYALSSIVGNRVTEPQGSGWKHTFTMGARTCDTLQTFTVESGQACGADDAIRATYGQLSSLTLELSQAGTTASVEAEGFAKAATVGTTLSGHTIQTVEVVDGDAGEFQLSLDGVDTQPLPFDAPASAVQAALDLVLGDNTTVVSGGPLNTDVVVIEFVGPFSQKDVATLTVVNNTVEDDQEEPVTPTVVKVSSGAEPTVVAVAPLLPEHAKVYADETSGSLGNTSLGRLTALTLTVSDRIEPAFYLDGEPSFSELIEALPEIQLETTVGATRDNVLLASNQVRSGETRYLRVEAEGPVLDGVPSKLTIDLAVQVEEIAEFADEDGVYAVTYTWRVVSDETATLPRFELTNDLETL